MRLLRVDNGSNKVTEIKTFEPLKSKYAAISTAVEQDPEGGKYLLDEGDGGYYEFDVKLGENGQPTPHFLPGDEGFHEGVPEKHLARIQRNPDSLRAVKEKYGDFLLDSPGAAPDENPFNAPPPPSQEELDAIAAAEEGREVLDLNAPDTEETVPVTVSEPEPEAAAPPSETVEGADETNAVEEITEEATGETLGEPETEAEAEEDATEDAPSEAGGDSAEAVE